MVDQNGLRIVTGLAYVQIIEKYILDLTPKERKQCRSLSLRADGLMCEDLSNWMKYEKEANRRKRKPMVWMIKDDDESLIGWALAMPRPGKAPGYESQFYVRKSLRNKGYGTMLMEKVRTVDPRPHVFPHDRTSGEFFKKHRGKIRYERWDRMWLM